MEEISSDTKYYSVFNNNHLLSKTNWSYMVDYKVDITKQKNVKNNDIKIHINKAKNELYDQIEKEICTVRKIVEENTVIYEYYNVKDISKIYFGKNRVMHKHFISQNVPYLSEYTNFLKFIRTYSLLARLSSSTTNVLNNRDKVKFLNKELVNEYMSYEDYTKLQRIIASHRLPKVSTLNINLCRYLWINLLWQSLKIEISLFNSKSVLKYQNIS